MRRSTLALGMAVVAAATLASTQVQANPVLIGTATGGMMIHYNNVDYNGDHVISGFDENPNNIAYVTSQFSDSNANGSAFSFATPDLQALFGQIFPSQFGLDLTYQAPTYDPSGPVVVPSLDFKDNGGPTTTGGTTAFGLDNYLGGGPAVASNTNVNSLLRGTGVTFNIDSLVPSGNIYTLHISGTLVTDGLVHWYTIGTPDSSFATYGFTNTLNYSGTLIYNKAGDDGSTQTDFYAGSVDLFANTVPLPSSALAGSALLGGLALVARRRNASV